tara:strand:+ start:20751 stop:21230 length:480 start_codon:yes stop_codon:yes gene_type:complete
MIALQRFFERHQGKSSVRYLAALAVGSFLLLILFFLFPDDASSNDLAQFNTENNEDQLPFKSNYSNYFLRTLGITGLIIIFILMGFKWYKSKLVENVNHFSMEVLGKQYISPKQYLIMVRIEGQKLLMGVTDQSINLIKEFSDGKQNKDHSDSNIISDP